jgi:hypothetical protein
VTFFSVRSVSSIAQFPFLLFHGFFPTPWFHVERLPFTTSFSTTRDFMQQLMVPTLLDTSESITRPFPRNDLARLNAIISIAQDCLPQIIKAMRPVSVQTVHFRIHACYILVLQFLHCHSDLSKTLKLVEHC